jgi:hypothetical protein
MVTSKPKRISVAAGLVHMMIFLYVGFKQTANVLCLYDCIVRREFDFGATSIHC